MEREESEGRKSCRRVFLQLRRQIVCHWIVSATAEGLAVRRAEHDTQIYLLGS